MLMKKNIRVSTSEFKEGLAGEESKNKGTGRMEKAKVLGSPQTGGGVTS